MKPLTIVIAVAEWGLVTLAAAYWILNGDWPLVALDAAFSGSAALLVVRRH